MNTSKLFALALTCVFLIATAFAADPASAPAKKGGKKGGKKQSTQAASTAATSKAAKTPVPLLDPPPSPTLGASAPEGAIVLFDGKNMDAWVHHKPKQWLTPGDPCEWPVSDGVVTSVPKSGSLITKREFGDFKLHAEFATTETPTNAGFYLGSRYELKIHETHGNPLPPSCGNFGNCDAGGTPKVNASRAKGEWQTFDVEYCAPRFDASGKKIANARATVFLNGVKIYDNQELSNLRLAAAVLGESARGPLQLKEHGNVVKYRNMWIVEMNSTQVK